MAHAAAPACISMYCVLPIESENPSYVEAISAVVLLDVKSYRGERAIGRCREMMPKKLLHQAVWLLPGSVAALSRRSCFEHPRPTCWMTWNGQSTMVSMLTRSFYALLTLRSLTHTRDLGHDGTVTHAVHLLVCDLPIASLNRRLCALRCCVWLDKSCKVLNAIPSLK